MQAKFIDGTTLYRQHYFELPLDYQAKDGQQIQVFARETELTLCEVEIFGRKNSIWEAWAAWSACSGVCHFGLKERTREFSWDVECEGEWHQSSWCNLGPGPDHSNLVNSDTLARAKIKHYKL